MSAPKSPASIAGIATAPEIFFEGYRGLTLRNGVVHINTFVNRFDPDSNTTVPVAGPVLAIPLTDFAEISQSFASVVADLVEKGLLVKTTGPAPSAESEPAGHA